VGTITELGFMVQTEPEKAAKRLRALLKKHKDNASAVARELEVEYRTVSRWFVSLEEAGFPVRERTHETSEIARLAASDPTKARAKIDKAVQKTGSLGGAAEELGVSYQTLFRARRRIEAAGVGG
jgi:molybdenum-dependent DNA-binding transcriptional regulator ModE